MEWAGVRLIPFRHPLQGLGDDVIGGNLGAKQLAGHPRHSRIAFGGAALGSHRRRGADTDQIGIEPLPHPSYQQRHISTLAAAVGVQFIENQELQTLGITDHLLIQRILSGEDVLQHHVVGEQDIGWIVLNSLALLLAFLARVACKGDTRTLGVTKAEVFLQFLPLAIAQGVHRIDDNRPDSLASVALLPFLQHPIDDRDHVAQRFTGAGAGDHHIAAAAAGNHDRVALVTVQDQLLTGACLLPPAEDLPAFGVHQPFCHQLADAAPAHEAGIELDQRRRPVLAVVVATINKVADVLGLDAGETAAELAVVRDDLVAERKDIHQKGPPQAC